jgi:hypothetical protein
LPLAHALALGSMSCPKTMPSALFRTRFHVSPKEGFGPKSPSPRESPTRFRSKSPSPRKSPTFFLPKSPSPPESPIPLDLRARLDSGVRIQKKWTLCASLDSTAPPRRCCRRAPGPPGPPCHTSPPGRPPLVHAFTCHLAIAGGPLMYHARALPPCVRSP